MDELFNKAYKRLNKAQKQAVDAIEGPVMVIAGPGTGKTTILTLRIANILKKTDASPQTILALTFTESGVDSMRKKLIELVGEKGYKVNIATFHSFSNDIIRQFPERFERIIGATPVNNVEKERIFTDIIALEKGKKSKGKLDKLRPYGDTSYYVGYVESEIQSLKREGISADDFYIQCQNHIDSFEKIPDLYHEKGAHKGKMKGEYVKQKERMEKNMELAYVYMDYELALEKGRLYDFEDMIMEVAKKMREDGDFKLILQESYQYILADEHQDANNAQNAILELLSDFHDNPNLFIVGDEKQAIFRFQGASLENFLYFKKRYKDSLVINLDHNYRSHQNILDTAHSLITKNPDNEHIKKVELKSGSSHDIVPIDITETGKMEDEIKVIVQKIKSFIDKGSLAHEIAVIYRNNKDSLYIGSALDRQGIPYQIESDSSVFDDIFVQDLMALIKVSFAMDDDETLTRALFVRSFGLDPVDIYKCISEAQKDRSALVGYVSKYFPKQVEMIKKWSIDMRSGDFADTVEDIMEASGILVGIVKATDSVRHLDAIRVLLGEIRTIGSRNAKLSPMDIVRYLDQSKEKGGKGIKMPAKSVPNGKVRLMTAHRSKGLEFDHVFIPHVNDGVWSNVKERKKFHIPALHGAKEDDEGKTSDERRLLYVALTRARKTIDITYHTLRSDGNGVVLRSQFIEELDPKLISITNKEESEKIYGKPDADDLYGKKKVKKERATDKEYILEKVKERGISVTALNNYLDCPWKYVFSNVIRLPEKMSKYQMFGTAIHETLQTFFNKYREDETMSTPDLLQLFEHRLSLQPLSAIDFKDTLKEGKEALGGYVKNYNGKWPKNIKNELKVRGIHINNDDRVHLTGQIDKIEFLDNGSLRVVDYKTKAPISRNEIEGKTKNSDGRYKRQLVFYKVLLDSHFKDEHEVVTGELDFVIPDAKGTYKKESFDISGEEVAELKEKITAMVDDVFSFSFFDRKCDDKDCKYCAYRDLIY